MTAAPDQDDERADLDATITVTGMRAIGGILQDGASATAQVYLELTGIPTGTSDDDVTYSGTFRFVLDLDQYFPLMAALERAGKVALLMPADQR